MESYVEVTYLTNVLMILVSCQLAQYISLKPISSVRLAGYAIIQSFINCALWMANSWVICCIIEAVFFILFFTYAKKTWLISICIRYLFMVSGFVLLQGSFHNGIWFVPMHVSVIWLWLVLILMSVLLFLKWNVWVAKMNCIYDTRIYTKDKTLRIKGYLDSGNLLSWQGTPVIFLPKNYHAYFQDERIELIVMNTIAETSILRCYLCELQLAGCQRHQVYVHCEKELALPQGCNALLNMKVMTMG